VYSAAAVVVAAAMRFEPSGYKYEKGGGSLLKHFIELAILAISRRNLRRVMNVLSLSFKRRSDLADATDCSREVRRGDRGHLGGGHPTRDTRTRRHRFFHGAGRQRRRPPRVILVIENNSLHFHHERRVARSVRGG
jgi:hypothetical protein